MSSRMIQLCRCMKKVMFLFWFCDVTICRTLRIRQNYATSCMNICKYLLDFAHTDSGESVWFCIVDVWGKKIMNLLSARGPSSRLIFVLLFWFLSHLSTAVAWIEETCKHFVIYKWFGRISLNNILPYIMSPIFHKIGGTLST